MAEERRERRRLKILQNSEDRMKKLLGTYNKSADDEVETQSKQLQNADEVPPSDIASTVLTSGSLDINPNEGRIPNLHPENVCKLRSDQTLFDSENDVSSDLSFLRESTESIGSFSLDSARALDGEPQLRERVKTTKTRRASAARKDSSLSSDEDSKIQPKKEPLIPCLQTNMLDERSRAMICMAAAFFVRLVLPTIFGFIFLYSMIIPFGIIESCFLYSIILQPQVMPSSKGNMLITLLTLFHFPADILSTYSKVLTLATMAIEDFATYFVMFVVVDFIFESLN